MKKKILVAGLIAMLSTASVMPVFGDNGRMVTGWQFLNKCWYYFSTQKVENQPVGSLYVNKVTPDGYRVDSNGIWIR